MQYVPGRSLQARVEENGPLAVEEVLRIGMQAAAGLAAAHAQGLVHRDVKPSNILLEESVERAVLTDFGLARAIDDASLTQTGVLAGTPHYMSPEQATGEAIDHRSDLFSLGGVLYFMATGRPPFRADGALAVLHRICREPHRPAWQVNREVPDQLSDVIDRLLEKKAGRRYGSAAEVRDELAALLSRAQRVGLGRRRRLRRLTGSRLSRKSIYTAAASAVVVAAMAAVVTYATWRYKSAETGRPTSNADRTAVAESERDFQTELLQTRAALNGLESAPAIGGGSGDWSREVEALNRELAKIEARDNAVSLNKGAK
jgi:serine/threonine-protein kinase